MHGMTVPTPTLTRAGRRFSRNARMLTVVERDCAPNALRIPPQETAAARQATEGSLEVRRLTRRRSTAMRDQPPCWREAIATCQCSGRRYRPRHHRHRAHPAHRPHNRIAQVLRWRTDRRNVPCTERIPGSPALTPAGRSRARSTPTPEIGGPVASGARFTHTSRRSRMNGDRRARHGQPALISDAVVGHFAFRAVSDGANTTQFLEVLRRP